jgi:hypothetical protein
MEKLYEMAIPVVETADKWPGFLQQVRVAVFTGCERLSKVMR